MDKWTVRIYASGDELPDGLREDNFFHSPQFFHICRQTPRHKPYMLTTEDEDGRIVAQMLALVRYRTSWLPPFLYMHCRVLGEGVFEPHLQTDRAEIFGLMLKALKRRMSRWTLYIEVSHLTQKMFAYRQFRENGFFPVKWMSIHNSLHSHTPEERITPKLLKRINTAYQKGIVTDMVHDEKDFTAFTRLLRHHNWLKPKRYIPSDAFFRHLWESDDARLYVTRFHGYVIGCSLVVLSRRQAYLWYAAYRRKSFARLRPRTLTIWHTLKEAEREHCEHMYFMDVGLPLSRNYFRDFILRFGGKPVSTYRWFHCPVKWLNALLSWLFRY